MDDKEKNKTQRKTLTSKNVTPVSTRGSTADEVRELRVVIEQLVQDNKEIKEKVDESAKFNEFVNEKFEEYKSLTEEVRNQLNEITKQNKILMEKNERLEEQLKTEKQERNKLEERIFLILNPLEIEKRSKNLELHGLPETENENCHEKIKEIMNKITPKPVAVVNCYRTGYKYKRNGDRNTRPIFIKFENKDHRDVAYASRSNLRKFEEQKIYLNEDLPPNLRVLRGKANALKKEKGFKFLWVKNGNLFLRKNEDSKIYNIKTASDLEKLN